MAITSNITITELSRLTNKSRPTLYKYVGAYDAGDLDGIPHALVNLFKMLEEGKGREQIKDYCLNHFGATEDKDVRNITQLLNDHKGELDLEKIRKLIEKEIEHGK